MLVSYFPILVFILVGLTAGVLFILLGVTLDLEHYYVEKDTTYECGFEVFRNAKVRFDVHYYPVAILFTLFDLGVAFMLPQVMVFRDLGAYGL